MPGCLSSDMSTVREFSMKKLTMAAAVTIFAAGMACGGEWQIIGTRAQGMGGAHVAVASDATASYWNPAGLARLQGYQTRVDVGVNLQLDPDLLDRAEEIFDFIDTIESGGTDYDQIIADIDAGTATDADLQEVMAMVVDGFRLLDDVDFGGVATAYVAASSNIGHLGLSLNGTATVNVTANVDLSVANLALAEGNVDPADNIRDAFDDNGSVYAGADPEEAFASSIQAIFETTGMGAAEADGHADDMVLQAVSAGMDVTDPNIQQIIADMAAALTLAAGSGDLLTDNNTTLDVSGAVITEIVASYGHPFADGKLCLGVNIKAMEADTFFKSIPYDEFEESEDQITEILDDLGEETSTAIGIDLGILFSPNEMFTVGITARNINSPEFDFDGSGDWEVEPQIRAGVAFKPISAWTIAADIDLTENELKGVDEIDTQFVSFGTEFALTRILALRAGANLNLEDEGLDELYTVGVGVGVGQAVRIDIAAALAGDRADLDFDYDMAGFDLPSGVGVSIAVQVSTKF